MKNLIYIFILVFSVKSSGQVFTKLTFKAGPNLSGQIKTPRQFGNRENKGGLSGTIEPTILTFGPKKQFDLNADISYIQKGGENYSPIYTYQFGQIAGIGSESYVVTINYLSFSPTVKLNFLKVMFFKAGPRMDRFLSFKAKDRFSSEKRTNKDFDPITFGATYGLGISVGKNRFQFVCELVGQNDFTRASYYSLTGQTFRNFSYLLNFGLMIKLKSGEK